MRTLLAAAAMLVGASSAQAVIPVYGSPGTENPVTYTFTAAADTNVTAFFVGGDAGFTSTIGLLVNGVDRGITGLNNQSSVPGQTLDFGTVAAGDVLTFFLNVQNTGLTFFSDTALNPDNINHVFSADYSGGDFGIPAGTFVGFEDLLGGGDFDYNDHQYVFVFEGGGNPNPVPEPATWAMLIAGFGLVGAASRRHRGLAVTTA